MILNVIKESDSTSNNTTRLDKIVKENSKIDNVQLKRIKELLNENELKYVSENVRQLLDITISNDPLCFVLPKDRVKRIVQSGQHFRVILYVRLSQEDGDLEDGDVSTSIKNQLLYLLDECRKREWTVVGIFCEEDISGVDDNRPEWLKSIRFAECGNTEIVLCKSQSRFTRSMEMVEKYLHTSFPPFGYLIDPNDKHHLIPDPYAKEAIKIMIGMLKQGKSMNDLIEVLMRKGYETPADYKRTLGYNIYRGKNKIKSFRYEVEVGD